MTERSFVVTVSAGDSKRRQVWNTRDSLAIGQSLGWVAERAEGGALKLRPGWSDSGREALSIEPGRPVELPGGIRVELREALRLEPAFRSERQGSGPIQIYACRGEWSELAEKIGGTFVAKAADTEAFTLERRGEVYLLVSRSDDLRLEKAGALHQLAAGQTVELNGSELLRSILSLDPEKHGRGLRWVFHSAQAVELPDALLRDRADPDPENGIFGRYLLGAVAVVGGLVALCAFFVHPAPEPPEATYTQLVLEHPVRPKPVPAKLARAAPAPSAPAPKAEKPVHRKHVAPAPALQGKRLQSAASGLLHGGMSRLLKESSFAEGKDGSDSGRKLFDSKSPALVSSAPVVDGLQARSVQVNGIGGSDSGKGKQGGVGYGHGDHATVGGQGRSYVGMDTTGSSVEDGLTREQVGAVIHRHLSEIRYCYESSLLRFPDIEGKLLMGFRIGGQGSVRSADVRSSTLKDGELDDCIRRRLVTWKFPNTRGGVDVAVTYPFIFKSLGR